MTTNSPNGHYGHNVSKKGFSQVNHYIGVGLISSTAAVILGTFLLLSSNSLSEEMAILLLSPSAPIANVGQHLVKKESEKKS